MSLTAVNPATGRRLAAYRTHARAEIERRVAQADAASHAWRLTSPRHRASVVRALGRALRKRSDALAALATAEMGKPIAQARAEVEKCAALCDYYAAHGPALLADQRPLGAPANARVRFEPLGVVLAIMPWNFPFWQALRAAVPTLLAGNAVLLKHAPSVPGCALALEKVFAAAGFTRGVFQTLLIDTRPVPALLSDDRIRGVTLTGSTAAGKAVGALAAAAMKPAVFELGGSDPLIVCDDADLEHAADIAAQARLMNSGQSCICAKRIIVARAVAREFESLLAAQFRRRHVGDPTDPATDVGPLARADLRDALQRQVAQSIRQGARLVLGGAPIKGPGFFYAPTILADVTPGMAVFDEETFGPVAALVTARDDAHAIKLANATAYGLGAAIFTRSGPRARRMIPQLDAGCVFVNDFVRSSPELPFGGTKQSGYGRELGAWGLHAFTNVKTVVGL